MKKTIKVVSGGFDPVHTGHIRMFEEASNGADMLVVLVNSDQWLTNKKGKPFMPISERLAVVRAMGCVGLALEIPGYDENDRTAISGLDIIRSRFPNDDIIFCNGGDRGNTNTPEADWCAEHNIKCEYGVGGEDKANSSSTILSNWSAGKTVPRPWGFYRTLVESPTYVVKELNIAAGSQLSLQLHHGRQETWTFISGNGVMTVGDSQDFAKAGDVFVVPKGAQHTYAAEKDTVVIEVWSGPVLAESDIVRLKDYYSN